MKTFKDFINESIDYRKLQGLLNFKGTLEDNKKGIETIYLLFNSDCESLLQLYCCIWDDLTNGFCKTGSNIITAEDKLIICRELSKSIKFVRKEITDVKGCDTPNCDRKYMLRGDKHG